MINDSAWKFGRRLTLGTVAALLLLCSPQSRSQQTASQQTSWQSQVNAIIGWQGQEMPDGVLRFTLTPHVQPTLAGVKTDSNLFLDGYVAFRSDGNSVLAVLEAVAPDEKVDAVWRTAEAGGLQVSAIHSHVVLERPRVKFLHASGHGDAAALARAVKATISAAGWPPSTDEDSQDADDVAPGIDSAAIDVIMKASGKKVDGVLEYTFDRPEEYTLEGHALPPAMGPESEIHFQSIPKYGSLVVTEFALLTTEVEKVVQLLRASDQKVTVSALHNHFIGEDPRLYYLHVAGIGDPQKLAQLMRAALNLTPQMPSQ
jgi:hypothetical protein